MGIGDWGLGIGDWGLGPIPNPQSPIPNPQSPHPQHKILIICNLKIYSSLNIFIILLFNRFYIHIKEQYLGHLIE
jgi:hypothetical protein